jgi:hypothetical protein
VVADYVVATYSDYVRRATERVKRCEIDLIACDIVQVQDLNVLPLDDLSQSPYGRKEEDQKDQAAFDLRKTTGWLTQIDAVERKSVVLDLLEPALANVWGHHGDVPTRGECLGNELHLSSYATTPVLRPIPRCRNQNVHAHP